MSISLQGITRPLEIQYDTVLYTKVMTQQAQSDSIEVGDSVTLLFFAGWIMMDLLFLLETYTNLFKRSCLEVNHMLCLGDPIACCLSIASVSY